MPSSSSVFIRNLIYGVEDSLVSTVGLLAGLASQSVPVATILLTGFTYLCVEGFSMAVGSFLSEESTEMYDTKGSVSERLPLLAAFVSFVSFVVTGLVPVLPYIFWSDGEALWISVILSLILLGVLGAYHARLSKVKMWPRIIRMMLIGGVAIVLGVVVSKVVGAA